MPSSRPKWMTNYLGLVKPYVRMDILGELLPEKNAEKYGTS